MNSETREIKRKLEEVEEELADLVANWGAHPPTARLFALAQTKAEEARLWLTEAIRVLESD